MEVAKQMKLVSNNIYMLMVYACMYAFIASVQAIILLRYYLHTTHLQKVWASWHMKLVVLSSSLSECPPK